MSKLETFKSEYKDRTMYFTYTEQVIFISRRCYLNALFIILGTMFICGILSKWYCYGTDLSDFWTYYYLALTLVWLFIIKNSVKILDTYCSKVQVLKKVRVEYKDGTISEVTNF